MEDESYETIREEVKAEPEKAVEPEKVEEKPDAALGAPSERQKAAGPETPQTPQKKARKKAEEKPKEKPPRMICEGCGRSYSIHTKHHVCKAPKSFEKKENIPPQTFPPPPLPGPAERQITLADVTQFLFAESKARRDQRRDDLLAKMF